jgi:Rhodopirellula transposase DDE domain
MELTDPIKEYLRQTAESLGGVDRRLFLARTVLLLGDNGQRLAERELGWNRGTIRKGLHELTSGIRCVDAFSARGRKRAEEHLPGLLPDIRSLIDGQSQTDPTFSSQRLYTRLTAAEVRRQLISQKGYGEAQLPCDETIRQKMHDLGYHLRRVAKCKPKKSYPRRMPFSPA